VTRYDSKRSRRADSALLESCSPYPHLCRIATRPQLVGHLALRALKCARRGFTSSGSFGRSKLNSWRVELAPLAAAGVGRRHVVLDLSVLHALAPPVLARFARFEEAGALCLAQVPHTRRGGLRRGNCFFYQQLSAAVFAPPARQIATFAVADEPFPSAFPEEWRNWSAELLS
jgi:hypothetical protein